MEKTHYLYHHIRLDTLQVFYVGIGTIHRPTAIGLASRYSRAYSQTSRTAFWKNVAKKAGYKVEVIAESKHYESIKELEVEHIKKYGRKVYDEGGILTNLSIGGDGVQGTTVPLETKIKIANTLKGRKRDINSIKKAMQTRLANGGTFSHSKETKEKIAKGNLGKKRTYEQIKTMKEVGASNVISEKCRKALKDFRQQNPFVMSNYHKQAITDKNTKAYKLENINTGEVWVEKGKTALTLVSGLSKSKIERLLYEYDKRGKNLQHFKIQVC